MYVYPNHGQYQDAYDCPDGVHVDSQTLVWHITFVPVQLHSVNIITDALRVPLSAFLFCYVFTNCRITVSILTVYIWMNLKVRLYSALFILLCEALPLFFQFELEYDKIPQRTVNNVEYKRTILSMSDSARL